MSSPRWRPRAAVLTASSWCAVLACAGARPPAPLTTSTSSAPSAVDSLTSPEAMAAARADSIRRPYTEADIGFMTRMIGHHAQAIEMASMAETHGAGKQVRILAERIINAQRDEIRTMRHWLADRGQPVPDGQGATHAHHMAMDTASGMAAASAAGLMPGMLTETQMRQLDAARGDAFDILFLRYMIQHHSGAVQMVEALFDTYAAGQDELVFKLATDVNVDQSTEIERMQRMLAARLLAPQPDGPAPPRLPGT